MEQFEQLCSAIEEPHSSQKDGLNGPPETPEFLANTPPTFG
jgi:hypothetical protein